MLPRIEFPHFDKKDLDELRALFIKLTGNKLEESKMSLIESRLQKKLIQSGISPDEYVRLVKSDSKEQEYFISALTTHKTDWFREIVHFDFMIKFAKQVQSESNKPLTIWSAACSTGEECYSAAILLRENGVTKFRILGTDISQHCLETASQGIYQKSMVDQQVNPNLKKKYFLRKASPEEQNIYKVNPELKFNLKWKYFNLLQSQLDPNIQFDLIFLRNVLIYFDQDACSKTISKLASYLRPGGHLIVGLSEMVPNPSHFGLTRVENSIYKKR